MSEGYKIEKGVPIPPWVRGRPALYPFKEMAVGDSFVVDFPITKGRSKLYESAKNAGIRIATRTEGIKGNVQRIRVWRVE